MNIHSVRAVAFFLLFLAALSGCKEVGPLVDLGKGGNNSFSDTVYTETPPQTPATKQIIMEELTGVQCANCPDGATEIEGDKATYPNRIISIGVYSAFQNRPVVFPGDMDLYSTLADSLVTFLTDPGFKPSAAIDRKVFDASVTSLCYTNPWNTYVSQELALSAPVNIEIGKTYDSVMRNLTITVTMHYTATVADSNKLSIMLTEDSLISGQLDNSGGPEVKDTFYSHNEVLRKIVTYLSGDKISAPLQAGTVVRKVYKTQLNPAWKPKHLNIVAFVHKYNGSKEILQGAQAKVIN